MVAEKTKVPDQLTLKWGDYPESSRQAKNNQDLKDG